MIAVAAMLQGIDLLLRTDCSAAHGGTCATRSHVELRRARDLYDEAEGNDR